MIIKYEYKNLTWIDIESPKQDEIRKLMDEYSIHPFVANELLLPTIKPRVELYDNYIYLILHFPVSKHSHFGKNRNQEIDFIMGKDFIITTRYDKIDPMHSFSKTFEINSVLEKGEFGGHAGFIFYHMINKIYKSVSNEMEYTTSRMERIEDDIFKGKEREMVQEMSEVGRVLLDFNQTMSLHDEVLDSFKKFAGNFFGTNFTYFIESVISEENKIMNNIQKNKEVLYELRETNNSLLSTKQNEIMKTITIFAFIFLPFSIISGFFQINTINTPIVGSSNDWLIVVGFMFLGAIFTFIIAKMKKWL